jgi:hypothetical protein
MSLKGEMLRGNMVGYRLNEKVRHNAIISID